MKRLARTLSLSACLLAVLAPAAHAAKVPTITSVSPKKVRVGEKLVLRGKNFLPGKGKSRVYFLRGRGKLAWAPADTASKRRLVVTVPESIVEHLTREGDGFAYTRFKVRVLGKRFGKATKLRRSPLISAASSPGGGGGTAGPTNAADGDCDKDGVLNGVEADDDNDVVLDSTEQGTTLTDPCDPDTDGDGVEDGYEWGSALDLNNNPDKVLPYPGKRPYPNALDGSDANTDYDGDSLPLVEEHLLWFTFGGHTPPPFNYSDGTQTSRVENVSDNHVDYDQRDGISGSEQTLTAWALDHNGDGRLRDDERDADDDGLSNWDESQGPYHGRMDQDWWDAAYKEDPQETRYVITYGQVGIADPDSDGDGLKDGGDDQDHDGLMNAWEVRRATPTRAGAFPFVSPAQAWYNTYVSVTHPGTNPWARVQPFNPCKPIYSEACHLHPPFDYYEDDEDWESPCQADELGFPTPGGPPPGGPPTIQSLAPELPRDDPADPWSCPYP